MCEKVRNSRFPKGRMVFFVTTNLHKFNEGRQALAEHGIAVALLRIEAIEIQSDSLEEIARAGIRDAVEKTGLPTIVEDAGLFIDILNGFPGPYSSYVYRTLGTRGILKLMTGKSERGSHFYSVVAYHSSERISPKLFHGNVEGTISISERGNQGFGFDPIFKPKSEANRTFAEMSITRKNTSSHRAQALRRFAAWYSSL